MEKYPKAHIHQEKWRAWENLGHLSDSGYNEKLDIVITECSLFQTNICVLCTKSLVF